MKQFFSIFLLSGMMICSVVGCDGNKPMSSLILGELHGNVKTCKISTYILYIGVTYAGILYITRYKAKRIGIVINIGKHPLAGLTPYF